MRPYDTTPIAHRLQIALYRRMGPAARVALAISMSEEARRVMAAGTRARHPEYDDEAVLAAVRRVTLGDRLFRASWPRSPVVSA